MIRLGIIGLNEGNGHPYSYSAIFNGFDESELMKGCPFQMIKQYLPREHRNRVFIADAKITHIWTQDRDSTDPVGGDRQNRENHHRRRNVARTRWTKNIYSTASAWNS